jgi:DNA-directed RNA polymerase subunit RPC12/RpoP
MKCPECGKEMELGFEGMRTASCLTCHKRYLLIFESEMIQKGMMKS